VSVTTREKLGCMLETPSIPLLLVVPVGAVFRPVHQ